jgi:cytoskeletal protein CcmA (bactofilin family)
MDVGHSLSIKGELHGDEDLEFHGHVTGKIDLGRHTLTVGAQARVEAEVIAKAVIVFGSVTGKVTTSERFDLRAGGTLQGQLSTPKLAMADGAHLEGDVEMPARVRSAPTT